MSHLLRLIAWLGIASVAMAAPARERNVTFISTSDAHYDAFENEDRNGRNRETVEEINRIAGQTWPEQLGGGLIDKPRGVLLLGDVIDDGDRQIQGKTQGDRQFAAFLADFGLDGADALLKYTVFEGWGNHDGPPAGKEKFGFSYQAQLKKRNAIRKEKGLVSNLSANGMHYSWDWDDVHFVQLNLYPADKQREGIRYSPVWHDPQMALSFLREDLAKNVGNSGRPVVLMSHCGVDTDWWVPADWKDFYDAAKAYNVVLYLYGHSGTGIKPWAPPGEEKKWLCINDGQVENGFFLIQITGDRLRAGQRMKENVKKTKNADKTETREWDGTWGWKWLVEKKLTGDDTVRTPTTPMPAPAAKPTATPPLKPQPAPAADPAPSEPMASYQRGGGADPISAINDGRIPASSYDTKIPRFTWWGVDQKGKKQWVQQNLNSERVVSSCEVYWFDETPVKASCRVPQSWRLLYREGTEWKEVKGVSGYGVAVDQFNAVAFEPVKTTAMRLEVQCQKTYCAGVLEWRILPAGPDDAEPAAPAKPVAPEKPRVEASQPPQPPLPAVAMPRALVLLDAESLPEGPLSVWRNAGSLGGQFASSDKPLRVQTIAGRKAVVFGGDAGLRSAFAAPDALAGRKPFTIEAWVHPERLVSKMVIASWASRPGGFAEFGYGHGREGVFASGAGRTGFNRPPAAKKWHHTVCTYADGQLSVYADGELNTRLAASLVTGPGDAIHIGTAFDPAKNAQGFGYRGGIARLQMWDRALSHREVRNLGGDFAAFASEPRDGATLEANSATLRWQTGHADARSYRVQLATDRDALERSALPDAATAQLDTGTLTLGRTYFWRILQLGDSGQMLNAGPVWSFNVSAGPAADPQPRNRVAGVRANVTELSWRPGRYAVSQDVHFGTDAEAVAASTAPIARDLPISTARLPIPAALEPGRTYYWRVDQNNGALPPAKGEVWAFRTEDAPVPSDVTFFVISDTHYGLDPRGDELLPKLVDQMNWLPGTRLPDEVGGGIVRTPRGVIHCGDITAESRPEEWPPFVRDFGLNGEGRLAWPVYESFGNHDGGVDRIVRRSIKERNPKRTGLTRISPNGMHCSWDWDQVHFVNLNISVGDTFHPYDPQHSYDFLVSELARLGDGPIVLLQHMGFDKESLTWWKEEDRQRYCAAIKDKQVLGIFHGHDHNSRIFKWNGIDIFNVTHMQVSEANPDEPARHGFFVVRITPNEMIVAERLSDGTWGARLRKPLGR